MTTTLTPADHKRQSRGRSSALLAMSVLASLILGFRTIRTATEPGPLTGAELASVVLALVAIALTFTGVAIAPRSGRRAALPIGVALAIELLFANELAPPRLIAAIPLFFAMALVLSPERSTGTASGESGWTIRNLAPNISLGLMVPVGFAFIATGLVAPMPDLFGAYALYGVLLTIAVGLAVRQSRWVVVMPFVSAASWLLMLWFGDYFLNWSP